VDDLGQESGANSVALPSDVDAVAALKAENPDIEVLAKHVMGIRRLDHLGMMHGDITEWTPFDYKQKTIGINGQATIEILFRTARQKILRTDDEPLSETFNQTIRALSA
jgi:hypothetical protein